MQGCVSVWMAEETQSLAFCGTGTCHHMYCIPLKNKFLRDQEKNRLCFSTCACHPDAEEGHRQHSRRSSRNHGRRLGRNLELSYDKFIHGVHNVKLKTLLARGFQEWRRRRDGDALAGDVVNDAGDAILKSDLLIPRREEKSTVFFGQSSCRERRMQHSNAAMSGIF